MTLILRRFRICLANTSFLWRLAYLFSNTQALPAFLEDILSAHFDSIAHQSDTKIVATLKATPKDSMLITQLLLPAMMAYISNILYPSLPILLSFSIHY